MFVKVLCVYGGFVICGGFCVCGRFVFVCRGFVCLWRFYVFVEVLSL